MKLYLRLCLTFAFLSLAVYFSKTYFFNHSVDMSIKETFPAEDHYSRHKTAAFMNLSMPSCLQKWRERDLLLVRQRVQETYPDMLSSSLSSPCPQALAAPHFYAAFHQPHFSEYFFTFLSLMLWQSDVFPPRNVTSPSSTLPCIRYMGIPDEITEFWRDQKEGRKTWVMQLISAMKPFLGESFFLSSNLARRLSIPLMKHHILPFENSSLALYRWFLHPSDASWLTSKLLQHDPCIDKAKSLLNSGLSVKILQRRGAREMVNTEEVINSVRSNGVALKSIEMIDFESSSLLQQAQQMYGSDVLITVHGAGQTNIVFMKPCSIVIEICPFGYCEGSRILDRTSFLGKYPLFATLGFNIDLVYLRWTEEKKSCLLKASDYSGGGWLTGNRKQCLGIINALPSNSSRAAELCMPVQVCRACARLSRVVVNTTMLQSMLTLGIEKRSQCLQKHPLYNN